MSGGSNMHEIIGREFFIDGSSYVITDVRSFQSEIMIYAEPAEASAEGGKMAFRFADIEPLLNPQSLAG